MSSLVSCVIPTYKRSDTLGRAIDSILSQTYKNIEVLVVDDNEIGSQESIEVKEKIDSYKDQRVKLVTQPKHINGAEARNAGIRAASGEYIAFLDDDDEWLPEKVEKQIMVLDKHPEIDGVSCLYGEYRRGQLFHSCPPYNTDNFHLKIFQREVAVFTSTILLRKKALLEAGIFDNTLRRHQDLQLLLDFTKDHRMYVINEYMVKLHADSAINRPTYEKSVEIKKHFFDVVNQHLEIYPSSTQKTIRSAYQFELALSALKSKRPLCFIKHLWNVGLNVEAYRLFFKRIKNKKYVVGL